MTENEFKNIVLEEFKIELTDDIMNKLNIYSSFLMEYNSHTNLTAIKNKEDIYLPPGCKLPELFLIRFLSL